MTYDPDYQKLIDEAVAKGDFKTAGQNERLRNQKIDDLGLDYEKTYKYVNYDSDDSAEDTAHDSYSEPEKPTYTDNYSGLSGEYLNKYLNRDAFSYDPEKDQSYLSYKDQYTRNGQTAMQDTMGQIAARTGGMASSYAGTAAQQTYNNYMQALSDVIPELRQAAYDMYQDEGNNYLNALSAIGAQQDRAYNQYQGQLSQYNTDRQFGYNAGRDAIYDARYADETTYDRGRDAIDDARYADKTAYERSMDSKNFDYQKGRDAVDDSWKQREFDYQKDRDNVDDSLKQREFDRQSRQNTLNRSSNSGRSPSPTYMVEGIGELPEDDVLKLLDAGKIAVTQYDKNGNPTGFVVTGNGKKGLGGSNIALTR